MPILSTIICCALVLIVADGAQKPPHPEHTWGYNEANGPSHWGELKPQFAPCRNGHHQSPSTSGIHKKPTCRPSSSITNHLHWTLSITATRS